MCANRLGSGLAVAAMPAPAGARRYVLAHRVLMAVLSIFAVSHVQASLTMSSMSDEELSDVRGAGIAIALEDFSFSFSPTSYVELTGAPTALPGWNRGDAIYYGLTISGGQTGPGTGTNFHRGASGGGVPAICVQTDTVGCPIGQLGATNFAPVYDPYVLRAFQYEGYDFQGNWRTGTAGPNAMPTVMEFIGPSNMDPWRWAFWGEIEVDRGGPNNAVLQSQSIINGKNATKTGIPSIFRISKTQNTADPTLGIMYQSALSGDFRFSVGQQATSPNLAGQVPLFNPQEGIYFRDVDAFLPMGRLHSMALTVDTTPAADGNFLLELGPVPNIAYVYNDIYCGVHSNSPAGCPSALESTDYFGRDVLAVQTPNPETHGYVRWGDMARPYTANDNGIYFRDNSGVQTHIGVARIEGMLIQHLRIETLGAGP